MKTQIKECSFVEPLLCIYILFSEPLDSLWACLFKDLFPSFLYQCAIAMDGTHTSLDPIAKQINLHN